jgi:hypothetical protein
MNEAKKSILATCIAVVLLAIGIGVLWLTKKVLQIEGDAVYVALLLVPVLVHLALTGKLRGVSAFGASLDFFRERADQLEKSVEDQVKGLHENVSEIGGYEPARNAYLGKLKQVLEKDGPEFCLIYADVDGLRRISREQYRQDREEAEKARQTGKVHTRKTEKEIQRSIINQLGLALADAFHDKDTKNAKYDIFVLEQPDVVMITRLVSRELARQIADKGRELFSKGNGYNATMAVLAVAEIPGEPTPRELDEKAEARLRKGKFLGSGEVYDRD